MRGHEALIAMRRNGKKAALVFVDVDAGPTSLPLVLQWQQAERCPDIDIPSAESIERTDWRPFIGLSVHVTGTSEARVRAAARGLMEAKAKRVVYALLRFVGDDEFSAWRTVWIHDTAGLMGTKEEWHGSVAA